MKLAVVFFLLLSTVSKAQHSIEKMWETDTILAEPESVLIDGEILYVSQVGGQPLAVDGNGAIAKLDKQGNIITTNWVTGLDAPKGMGLWKKNLYVTDITKIVVINTITGGIESIITIRGSAGLNDISFDKKGKMYVSDPVLGNVYSITNGKVELYLTNLKGANGLKVIKDTLYLITENEVLKITGNKKQTVLVKFEAGGDGIEPIGNGEFLFTCYTGLLYYLDKNGIKHLLLNTRDQKKGAADIYFDPVYRKIYVPTLFRKSVVAYRLN